MIAGVPLFSGFMYASVGSYVARATRIFDMKFAPYPPLWITFLFGALCYINFFMCGLVLWVAEFVGTTVTATWVYAGQARWETVSFAKMGSWYLLLYVAFVTVTLVSRSALVPHKIRPEDRDTIIGTEGNGPAARAG